MTRLRNSLFCLITLCVCQTSFADDLQSIYELAFKNDAQFRAARARLRADSEDEKLHRGALLPQINAAYSTKETDTENSGAGGGGGLVPKDSTVDNDVWSVQVEQSIIDLNKWFTFKGGQAKSQQAQVQFTSKMQDLIVRVVSAYFDVLRAQDNLTSSRAEEKAIQRQLEQTQQRFDVGLIAITDVHEAQAGFDIARVGRLNDEGLLGIAWEGLSVVTGQMHDNLAQLSEEFPIAAPQPTNVDDWVKIALETNAEIAASQHALESARMNAQASKAQHYPTLKAKFTYSDVEQDGDLNTFVYESTETEVLSFDVQIPLFSGGSVSAARRKAFDQWNVAKEEHVGTVRNAIQQTRSSHLQVMTDIAMVNARKQSITSSQSALDATEAGYEVGTRNVVDVLQAQRTLFAARRDYANARYDYVINMLKLKQQAGLLNPDDIAKFNKWLPEI